MHKHVLFIGIIVAITTITIAFAQQIDARMKQKADIIAKAGEVAASYHAVTKGSVSSDAVLEQL